MEGLTFPDDATLIARGKHATLRREHRRHAAALQVATVALHDQSRLMLGSVDDRQGLEATHDAMARREHEIMGHVIALLELQEQIDALKSEAWPK